MGYQDPNQVKSPKADVSHLRVLYDGGEQTADHGEWEGWSIAELDWQEKPALACRWNGSTDSAEISQVGDPQSRRHPIWFILPKPLEEAIRKRLREAPAPSHRGSPAHLAVALSGPAFDKVWNNPEDDVYDAI